MSGVAVCLERGCWRHAEDAGTGSSTCGNLGAVYFRARALYKAQRGRLLGLGCGGFVAGADVRAEGCTCALYMRACVRLGRRVVT